MITHPIDDLPAHALGMLDPEEQRTVDAHLKICAQCREEAHALGDTAWAVAEASARQTPRHLRDAIVSRARATTTPAAQSQGFFGRRALVMPIALAFVVVAAVVGYESTRPGSDPYVAAVGAAAGQVVALAQTGTATGSTRGSLVLPANGAKPYLILDLPTPPAGKTWEAWVIHGGTPVRAGITDARGVTVLELTAPLGAGDTVAITPEPPGGVDNPTGAPVLAGSS